MKAGQLTAMVRAWVDAMNEKRLDKVLALYADDADHDTPASTDGMIMGKIGLKKWWGAVFQRIPSLRYELQTITAQAPDRVVIEYKRCVEDEAPFWVAEVFEVNNDGFIVHSRVYRG